MPLPPSQQRLVLGLPGAALALAVLIPIGTLAVRLAIDRGSFAFAGLFGSSATALLLARSTAIAFSVTAVALVIGVPLGVLLGRTNVRARGAILALHAFPIFVPPFLLALGWFHIFGVNGVFGTPGTARLLFGPLGLIFVLGVTLAPIVTSLTAIALRHVDPSLEEAARVVASPVRTVENETVAMGDLVLTEEEYNGVIARLQEGGVHQTAVHKHLLNMSPAIWWTHIHAEGDPVEIAGTVRAALELTGTPPQAQASAAPAELDLDTEQISQTLGYEGSVNGGVYQVAVPRSETISASGIEVPASMGTATAINFQPTGEGRAAIAGDFVMTADEVQGVIGALEDNGIDVVALHNHMLTEEPRLFFLHFWANDDAIQLARGLCAALDQLNVQAGSTG